MAGDYLHYQRFNLPVRKDVDIVVVTQNYADVVAVKSAKHTIFIQKITLSITTHAAQTITFDDDGAGPAIAAHLDAASGLDTIVWDFGPAGRALTENANLDITQSAAGIVGVVHIEGYQKQTSAIPSTGVTGV